MARGKASNVRTANRVQRIAKKATPRKGKLRAATAKRAARVAVPKLDKDQVEFLAALREAARYAPNIADGYR